MSDILLIIPARYKSQRFYGKVLKKLAGKPILQWVYQSCIKSKLGEVIIATEDERVVSVAQGFGAKVIITSDKCFSGTDRVYEAAKNRPEKIIINVQGDEPFMKASTLISIAKKLKNDRKTDIATICAPITEKHEITDTNCVKAVFDNNGRALYFSRLPIPYHHPLAKGKKVNQWYKHCGLYGYQKSALKRFIKLPPSPLEKLERLEQLRALEAGMTISCIIIPFLGQSIDTPSDLIRARRYLRQI